MEEREACRCYPAKSLSIGNLQRHAYTHRHTHTHTHTLIRYSLWGKLH